MTPHQFLQTLQFSDTLFPTGGFAYSDGLETAVNSKLVIDAADLQRWLTHYIDTVFPNADGRAIRQTMDAYYREDWTLIQELDFECTALKPAAVSRSGSASLGKGFLKSVMVIHNEPGFKRLALDIAGGRMDGNLPVIYGVVFSNLKFCPIDALTSFAYTRLAGMISASLRLMNIGQQTAQRELSHALERVPAAVARIMEDQATTSLRSFSPILDIQQMNHRYVYSRLFRS